MVGSGGPTSEQTLRENNLDRAFDDLHVADLASGALRPKVCSVCDTFVKPRDFETIKLSEFQKKKRVLETDPVLGLDPDLKQDYKVTVPPQLSDWQNKVDGVLLSPRGTFTWDKQKHPAMSVCASSKHSLRLSKMPQYAIANGYFFGTPPSCLLDLTRTELAWISPVNPRYGLCFVYHGGTMQQLKGTLSHFKKPEKAVVVAAQQMKLLGLTDEGLSISIVGSATERQKNKVKKMSQLRPAYVLAAVDWLVPHNEDWKDIDVGEVRQKLGEPLLYMTIPGYR